MLTAHGEPGHGVAQHAYRPEDRRREHDATWADRKPREDPGDEQEHAAPLRDDVIDADPRKREPSDIGPETKPKSATNRPSEPHSPTGGNARRNSCRWKSGSVPKRGRHVCSTMALSDTLPLAITGSGLRAVRRQVGALGCDSHALAVAGSVVTG